MLTALGADSNTAAGNLISPMLDYVRKWDPHGHHNNTTISSCNTFAPGVFYNLIMQRFLLYTCIVGSSLCHMRFAFSFFVDQFFDFIIQQTSQQTSYPHQPPSIQKMQHCPVGFVCPLALICLNDKYNSITSTLIHCSHRNTDAYRCVQVVPLWHLFHHSQLANGMSARALCIHGCGMYHLPAMRCYAVGLVYHIVWGCMGYSQIAI